MTKVLIGNLYASDPISVGQQGPPGVPGPAGLTWRGLWSAVTAYVPNDVVSSPGTNGVISSYCAIQAGTNHAPSEGASNAWWSLLVQEGAPGTPATNLVTSVNGKQGVVVLNPSDIGAVQGSAGFKKAEKVTMAWYDDPSNIKDPDTFYAIVG